MSNKVIAFTPIRSGSKSIKDKNIKLFCGKPLIYWTTYALQMSREVEEIYIALDSEEYARIVEDFQFDKVRICIRDERNARDISTTEDVMLETINNHIDAFNHNNLLLVQCTNPCITPKQFDEAIKIFKKGDYDSMISCAQFKRFLWTWDGEPINYDFNKRPLKQQWDGLALENGIFYMSTVINILRSQCRLSGKVGVYRMPEWTQYEIDEIDDWHVMENVFRKNILEE